jgi:hypothetical protein
MILKIGDNTGGIIHLEVEGVKTRNLGEQGCRITTVPLRKSEGSTRTLFLAENGGDGHVAWLMEEGKTVDTIHAPAGSRLKDKREPVLDRLLGMRDVASMEGIEEDAEENIQALNIHLTKNYPGSMLVYKRDRRMLVRLLLDTHQEYLDQLAGAHIGGSY